VQLQLQVHVADGDAVEAKTEPNANMQDAGGAKWA
jgi:hypothetical protein